MIVPLWKMKQRVEVVYSDEAVVVVNKPPQFLSIPDRYRPTIPNVLHFLKEKYGEAYTTHRIDKETSGVMVFAKTKEAHKSLNQQFQDRTTHKIYWAIVEGIPFEDEGEIDKPIGKHPSKGGLMVISPKGKPSTTLYKVVQKYKNCCLVEANILTGRTHQVRVHLKSLGHPIIVDSFYGRKEAFYLSEFKKGKMHLQKYEEERPLMSRTCLHARRLEFDHPDTGARMSFEAEVPKDFKAVMNQLSKIK